MDVFSLRDTVVEDYEKFATSFTTIHAPDIATQIREIYDSKRYWPEPLIQINPNYLKSRGVSDFVAAGDLEPECAKIFKGLTLFKHQEQAIALASKGGSYVVFRTQAASAWQAVDREALAKVEGAPLPGPVVSERGARGRRSACQRGRAEQRSGAG